MTVTLTGIGHQQGPHRLDWGPGWADLKCDQCDATWTGPIGETCHYCVVALENMRRWQADIILHPQLPDIDDTRRTAAVHAWAQRLATAVRAGLITRQQADNAYQRERTRTVA
jgi:hypothetical protein